MDARPAQRAAVLAAIGGILDNAPNKWYNRWVQNTESRPASRLSPGHKEYASCPHSLYPKPERDPSLDP